MHGADAACAAHLQDPKKFARVRELLHLQQEIAAARKVSDAHPMSMLLLSENKRQAAFINRYNIRTPFAGF